MPSQSFCKRQESNSQTRETIPCYCFIELAVIQLAVLEFTITKLIV